jgi:hypothetical protein
MHAVGADDFHVFGDQAGIDHVRVSCAGRGDNAAGAVSMQRGEIR